MTRGSKRKVVVHIIEKNEVHNLRLLGQIVAKKINSRGESL